MMLKFYGKHHLPTYITQKYALFVHSKTHPKAPSVVGKWLLVPVTKWFYTIRTAGCSLATGISKSNNADQRYHTKTSLQSLNFSEFLKSSVT